MWIQMWILLIADSANIEISFGSGSFAPVNGDKKSFSMLQSKGGWYENTDITTLEDISMMCNIVLRYLALQTSCQKNSDALKKKNWVWWFNVFKK